ncbi:MAG: hypothetical protein ACE3L7_02675 [Candidatus Pristimantibacillus sp.]
MPNPLIEIHSLYEQLLAIMRQQLSVLVENMETTGQQLIQEDDQQETNMILSRFSALSLDWALLSQRIDGKIIGLQPSERQRLYELVQVPITEMNELTIQLEERLLQIRHQSVDMLDRVKQNRTVLRSYGGLDSIDITPMYFDVKN